MRKSEGKIIIEPGVRNILPWEMHSALALRDAGHVVRFIPKHGSVYTADAFVDNIQFEFKSPEGKNIRNIDNNLQKAVRYQSRNVVIDTCRVKNLTEHSIQNYLVSRLKRKRGIKRLLMITRDGRVIDIGEFVR